MSIEKIKLFETVLGISERGAVELTASEKSLIESETRDLLSAASRKQAALAPEGFESLLMSLRSSENADDAYEMVVSFLEQQGDPGCPGPGNGLGPGKGPGLGMGLGLNKGPGLGMGPELGGGPDKGPMPGLPMEDSKPMGMDMGMPELPKPESGIGGLSGEPDLGPEKADSGVGGLDKPEKSEDGEKKEKEDKPFPPKSKSKSDDKDDDDDKDEDKDSLKEKILAKSKAAQDGGSGDGGDSSDGDSSIGKPVDGTKELPWKKKKDDKKEDKDDDKEDKKEAMAIKDPKTASKVKVRVTSSRNILASFDDKPLFHAVPSAEVKADLNALKRLANKVYGWVVYEGAKSAATKCGSNLCAGVDDDVVTNFEEPVDAPVSTGVLDGADSAVQDAPEAPAAAVADGAEFDTQEVPDKVSAGVLDGAEVATEEKPSDKPSSALDDNETVHQEALDAPVSDVRDDAEVDYKSVKADHKKLYEARADKKIKAANAKFVEKFLSCMKIASTRMLINQDESPYKEASFDVLTDTSITFGDGAEFAGLLNHDAVELAERMAATGQAKFVDQLFERTADLMNKSDEYLSDLSSDLGNLSVKPVEVRASKGASRNTNKSEALKKEASEGNFVLNTENMGTPVTGSSTSNTDGVRAAVGGTLLSRRANVLERMTDCTATNQSKE